MNILVVNDDSISAPGIAVLAKAAGFEKASILTRSGEKACKI